MCMNVTLFCLRESTKGDQFDSPSALYSGLSTTVPPDSSIASTVASRTTIVEGSGAVRTAERSSDPGLIASAALNGPPGNVYTGLGTGCTWSSATRALGLTT